MTEHMYKYIVVRPGHGLDSQEDLNRQIRAEEKNGWDCISVNEAAPDPNADGVRFLAFFKESLTPSL
jgi:hypothetical protein